MIIQYRDSNDSNLHLIKEIRPNPKITVIIPQKGDSVMIDGGDYRVRKSIFNYDHKEKQMGQDVSILQIVIILDRA